jgi:hypothetical protein
MLIIRDDQFKAFEAEARDRFFDCAAAHLRKYFPSHTTALSQAELRDIVVRAADRAAAHGLTAQRDVLLYLNIAATYGWDFETDPGCRWMVTILNDPANSSPSDRLRYLIDRCMERQAREHERQNARREFGLDANTEEGA